MTSTLTCPHCNQETLEKPNVCIHCDKQIRCLNPECKEMLFANKTFCLYCTHPIKLIQKIESQINQQQINKFSRRIEQKGKNYKEETEFLASDHAIDKLAPHILGQMSSSYSPIQTNNQENNSQKKTDIPTANLVNDDNNSEGTNELKLLPEASGQKHSKASRYFEPDGEFLIAKTKDFKGKTWADQQRNFILLYTSAYIFYFNKPVSSKEHYKLAAQKAEILDSKHFSTYLKKYKRQYLSELESGEIKLNIDGQKEVERLVSLIEDQNVEGGYDYWNRTQTSSKKRQSLKTEDKEKLQQWCEEEFDLGNITIPDIKKAKDYAIISIYIIIVLLKKETQVRPIEAYHFF